MTGDNRAAEIVRFIREFKATHGYAPTVREISAGCDIPLCMVHYWLRALARRGQVTWQWGKQRTLRVIDENVGQALY